MNTPQEGQKKTAFVLSGGGNRGALEVGVLLALLEHDIRPQILVGTSVGAINATALAIDPTLEGARWLADLWRGVRKEDVLPNSYLSMVWRLLTGEGGIFTNENLRDFLASHIPDGINRFEDIKAAELYITAVDLNTGKLHVFGIDSSESVLDAIMASTALPPLLSPWQYQGRNYVDGAMVSDLPLRVALEMKATETYAICVQQRPGSKGNLRGVFRVVGQLINVLSHQRLEDELGWCRKMSEGDIHYIEVQASEGLRIWDFSHNAEMIETGRQAGLEYLRTHGLA